LSHLDATGPRSQGAFPALEKRGELRSALFSWLQVLEILCTMADGISIREFALA